MGSMAGQIILLIAYGIDVRSEGDPYVEEAEKVLKALMLGSTKGATLFDTITWCNVFRFLTLSKKLSFTDASGSNPYAKLVPRGWFQTYRAQVVLHRRQCSTGDV